MLITAAHADTWTGVAQPVVAPSSECSVPSDSLQAPSVNAQVVSRFSYWACKEYRSNKSKAIYYALEVMIDGEYVHLIPASGQNAIDPDDFQQSVRSVVETCQKIRDGVVSQMTPLAASHCSSP